MASKIIYNILKAKKINLHGLAFVNGFLSTTIKVNVERESNNRQGWA